MEKLTKQQQKFCRRYVVHRNATRAAEEVGYSHPNKIGPRLVNQPLVAAEITRLEAKVRKAEDADTVAESTEIQQLLTDMMRGKLSEEELSLSGDPVKRMATLETRRKAAMDLAKLKGLLRDKVDLNLGVDLKGVAFSELVRLARLGGEND